MRSHTGNKKIGTMNEYLANNLFRHVKQPAQSRLSIIQENYTSTKAYQIAHGRLGVSRCLLYTKDARTKTPSKPCTIWAALTIWIDEKRENGIPALLAPEAGMNDGQRDKNRLAQAYGMRQWIAIAYVTTCSFAVAQWVASLDQEPQIHHLLAHTTVYSMAQTTAHPRRLDQLIDRRHSLHSITHHRLPITTLRALSLRNQVALGNLLHVQVEGMFWPP